jgi:anti-sigma28 factor (negative regulator of flagellin synthesis)
VIDFDTLEEMMSIIARDEKLEWFDDPEFMSFLEKSIEKGRANIREGRYQVYDDTLKSNLITRLFDK